MRMSMSRTAAAGAVALSALALGTALPVTGAAAADKPAYCSASGDVDAKKLPKKVKKSDCDLSQRIVRYSDNVAVEVPAAGDEVTAEAYMTDGTDNILTLATSADGSEYTVTTPEHSDEAGAGSTTGGPAPCSDLFYRGAGYKISTQLGWYYNHTNAVGNLSNTQIVNGITKGASNMVLANNDCGDGRVPNSSHAYRGGTPRAHGVPAGSGAACSFDGVNVAGWQAYGDSRVLAAACVNKSNGVVSESDWALNRSKNWDETTLDGCSNAWVISGVMTHEWGHTIGLDHADEATHGFQTMSTAENAMCDNNSQTLAKGEVDAMIIKYGSR